MWFDVPHMAHLHEAVKAKRLQLMTEAESWRRGAPDASSTSSGGSRGPGAPPRWR